MANKKIEPLIKPCEYCGKPMELGGRGRPPLKTRFHWKCKAFARIIQPTIKMLDHDDAVFIAGLFDGEGSIILWDRGFGGRRKQLRCTISNTYEPIMHWLKETTGTGSIVRHKYPEETGYKIAFTWQCYGQNAVSLLKQMLPRLIIKKQRAEEALANQDVLLSTIT